MLNNANLGLLGQGASVVVVDPQPDHLERVASRIRAVAPGLDIIEVPVSFRQHDPYNPTPGSADTEQFGRVVDDIIFQKNQGINIVAVNMSWQINGGCDGNHPLLTHINRLRQNNIIPVGVSHNGGQANYISAPGCLPGVFTVGAVNTSDQVQTYSNSSPALDMLAPAATSGSFQGTSFAAPIVAAAVGALRAPGVRPGASMEEIL
ncbi:MAG: S8 family serine peptidase, partial [Aquisalimonadaceae bacterium]